MSLWQFAAAIGGIAAANSTGEDRLSQQQADELADFLKQNG